MAVVEPGSLVREERLVAEAPRLEEGQGLPGGEAPVTGEEPGFLFSEEQCHSSRKTDHHLRRCRRIPDRTESFHLVMNKYHLLLSIS
jgi:hypothetical protein